MREPIYGEKSTKLLESSFMFLANHGLENASIHNLCDATGIAVSSIYYWFEDKEDMIRKSAAYGLEKTFNLVFGKMFDDISSTDKFIENCIIVFSEHRNELRFLHQIAASPVYGEEIRVKAKNMNYIFDQSADRLANMLQCEVEVVKPYVYMLKCTLFNYIIWDNLSKVEMQLSDICSNISSHLHTQS